MELPSENYLKWFAKHGAAPPSHLPHGITDTPEKPLSEQLKPLQTANWRMEGNKLIADTEHGPLVQTIDPGYICRGTDDNGKPILEKIKL